MNMLIRRDEHNIDKAFRKNLYDAEENTPLHLWENVREKSSRKKRPVIWWFISAAAVSVACFCSILWIQNLPEQSALAARAHGSSDFSAPVPDHSAPVTSKSAESISAHDVPVEKEKTARGLDQKQVKNTAAKPVLLSARNMAVHEQFQASQTDINVTQDELKNSSHHPSVISETSEGIVQPAISIAAESRNETPALSSQIVTDILNDASLPMEMTLARSLPSDKPSRLSLGAYYAVSSPRRVSTHASSEMRLNELESRTKFGRAQAYGVSLNYALYKGIYISASIETSSFKESHTWYDTTRTQSVVYYENQVATYSDGSTIPVYVTVVDTAEHEAIEVLKSAQANSYSAVNVPLLAGVNIPAGKRFSFMAEAGPVFRVERSNIGSLVFSNGIQSPVQANFVSPDVLHSNLEYVYLNQYYSRWKTDIHAGLFVSAHLWKGWSLNAGAQCRWMLEKNEEIKTLSHRIVQPGIRAGIVCRL